MKKGFLTIVCLLVIALPVVPASAQTRYRRWNNDGSRYQQRVTDYRYRNNQYSGRRYSGSRWNERSFWDRHRDKLTTAIGAGAGAAVGAAVGGKKGAIIGAIAGGGGAAIYTYGVRDRNNNWRRRRY